jgi:hypothetical protein
MAIFSLDRASGPSDSGDTGLMRDLGPQDLVVASNFLCHTEPSKAENCLRSIAGIVKPGIDLMFGRTTCAADRFPS